MNHVIRITTALEVVKYWDLISRGIQAVNEKHKGNINLEAAFTYYLWLAINHDHAWIGIGLVNDIPENFAILQRAGTDTDAKTFQVVMFWHKPGHPQQTQALMTAFEAWAKSQGIRRYTVSTQRDTGAAIRCFQSSKFGFKKRFITFEKEL